MPEVRISGVFERDVDLLLLEEFVSSPPFLEWFMRAVRIKDCGELISAGRSVWSGTGESDLELTLRGQAGITMVLIENKVGAPLQPLQAERYRQRAATLRQRPDCSAAVTVVLAPTTYFADENDTAGFDRRVDYQGLLDWFERAEGLGLRGRCNAALLREAIDPVGCTLKPDKTATEFWRNYWEVASTIAPELRMPEPRDKPATLMFVHFRPLDLLSGISLWHKFPYGKVDLQFNGKADQLTKLAQEFGRRLDPNMLLEKATGSAVIRVVVPRIDLGAPFETSRPAVEQGLRAALQLLAWYRREAAWSPLQLERQSTPPGS